MREIKFRIFDGVEMNYNVIGFDYNCGGIKRDIVTTFHEKYGVEFYQISDNFPLMQYTGLKDKNGKEIYEGDIVVLSEIIYNNCSKSEIEGANSFIGEIVNYKGLCMCVKYKDKNGDTLYRPLYLLEQDITSDDCSLAIIGNIYENKDLLEK